MATTADYGHDLSCVDDLDEMATEVTGRRVLAERLVRRWTTPRGSVLDAPNEGVDVYAMISAHAEPADILRAAETLRAEALRDELVSDIRVNLSVTGASSSRVLRIQGIIFDADGPFPFTAEIGAVTVQLLMS